uniref:Uncharacterized protein n=1 Tax=viral metagenome TaxID=1070528 RepID=A0A6C0BIW9_9ZZZZ
MGMIFLGIVLFFIVVLICCHYRPTEQNGGEYVHFTHLPLDNSARSLPLGALSETGQFVPPEQTQRLSGPVRHSSPHRTHPHNAVHTNTTRDRRSKKAYSNYYYNDRFDYTPYDWRPYDWRPYWLRRANLQPSARDCAEYAADNCIGLGDSDFQSCYDQAHAECLRGQI